MMDTGARVRICAFLMLGFAISVQAPSFLDALTVYRIGGANLPPPELAAEEGVDFVQLQWEDVDEKLRGSSEQLVLTEDSIAPDKLDPSVNLTPRIIPRGGQIQYLTWIGWGEYWEDDVVIWDEDPETAFIGDGRWSSHGPDTKNLVFDFGGNITIERVRFYPREKRSSDRFIESFIIGTSDGDPLKDGTRDIVVGARGDVLDFDIVHQVTENTTAVVDLEMPLVPIRSLLFRAPENSRGIWELAELEIYGTGFAPRAKYVSNLIDLGGPSVLGELRWSASVDEGAGVDLTIRAGDDEEPNTYWRRTFRGDEVTRFDVKGRALVLSTYKKLERGEKAGITPDTENWAEWSTPLAISAGVGAGRMMAQRPRRFVQLGLEFFSNLEAGTVVEYVEFTVSNPPLASEIIGEITPSFARAGDVTHFRYVLRPRLDEDDLGFDCVEIGTPREVVSVDSVRIGGEDVVFSILREDDSGFEIELPRIDVQRTDELIEIIFQAEIFKFGTVFAGRVFDSTRPLEVRQPITPGDADDLVDSNTLSVGLLDVRQKNVVKALRVVPAVFTPNGDGVNDEISIEYDLLNLFGSVPLSIAVYDLNGTRLSDVFRGTTGSGRFRIAWNGRDVDGNLMSPGVYILRLEVQTDRGEDTLERIVSIAY